MILAFGDLNSPLIAPRIELLSEIDEVIAVANANCREISNVPFSVKKSPCCKNLTLRYILNTLYTFYLLLKCRPKLVAIHWASRRFQTLAFLPFAKRTIVSCMGGDIDKEQDFRGSKAFWIRLLLKNAALITVKSQFMKNMILENIPEIEESKIKIISWGVSERFLDAIPDIEVERFLDGTYGFLSIRALREFYRINEILEVFLDFKEESGANAKLIIATFAADKEYAARVKLKAENSRFKEDILFLEIPQNRLPSVLKSINTVISYSSADGLPQSVMEALAAQRPVIASDLGNYAELLNSSNSILCANNRSLKMAFARALEGGFNFEGENELLDKKIQSKRYIELCRSLVKETHV